MFVVKIMTEPSPKSSVGRVSVRVQRQIQPTSSYACTWKIDDFPLDYSTCLTQETRLFRSSYLFPNGNIVAGSTVSRWQLFVYVFKAFLAMADIVYVGLIKPKQDETEFKYELSLIDNVGNKVNGTACLKQEHILPKELKVMGNIPYTLAALISFDKKMLSDNTSTYLPNGSLTISCDIQLLDVWTVGGRSTSLHENLGSLLTLFEAQPGYSDVIFCIEGKNLRANKAILASKSKVFAAMIRQNKIDKDDNVIQISDFSYDVMRELIDFIYFERVENIEKVAKDLIVAAHHFELTLLKTVCERYLCSSLSVKNVCEIFEAADDCSSSVLQSKVVKFLQKNLEAVMETPEFEKCKESNPNLMLDMICTAMKKRRQRMKKSHCSDCSGK